MEYMINRGWFEQNRTNCRVSGEVVLGMTAGALRAEVLRLRGLESLWMNEPYVTLRLKVRFLPRSPSLFEFCGAARAKSYVTFRFESICF